MKILVTSVFLVAVFNAGHATKVKDIIRAPTDIHFRAAYLQMSREVVEGYFTSVWQLFCSYPEDREDWQTATDETYRRFRQIDVEAETLCSLTTNHIEDVLAPLVNTLDNCGWRKRGGPLGRYIVSSAQAFAKHVCAMRGEEIAEIFNLCAYSGTFTAPECKNFKPAVISIVPGHTTKNFTEEVCDIVPLGRACLLDEVEQNCHLDITKKAWEDLVDAILSPCYLEKL